jgi:hypothetical protein
MYVQEKTGFDFGVSHAQFPRIDPNCLVLMASEMKGASSPGTAQKNSKALDM